jgi:hypothetical protein
MAKIFTTTKTKESLLKKLRHAPAPSAEEVKEQRISFVYGSLDKKSKVTREQVRKMIEEAA